VVALSAFGTAQGAFADCSPIRPATAAEQKSFADALACFAEVAPAAPEGWSFRDDETKAPTSVCAGAEAVSDWSASRSYQRNDAIAHQDAAATKIQSLTQDMQARQKANQGAKGRSWRGSAAIRPAPTVCSRRSGCRASRAAHPTRTKPFICRFISVVMAQRST
jgi:hypothetical protein